MPAREKLERGTPGNLDRGLEARNRPARERLSVVSLGDVLAVKDDAAVVDRVNGVAHDQVAEGGLASAVGTHQHVGLAGGDVEVDVVEDGLRPRRR